MAERKIVLQDGSEFSGIGFGGVGDAIFEVVFNTSMVGYQEIISDPSYTYQGVVMTYPLIGNYGITEEDFESKGITVSSLIVREYNDLPSNFRYTKTLGEVMEENGIPCISGVDTRKLARHIRDAGTMRAIITDISTPVKQAVEMIREPEAKTDAVKSVSCKKRWYSRTSNPKYNVVVIDCGVKLGIIRGLNRNACNVTVMPYNATAQDVLATEPDGVFLSNGPGDPTDVPEVIELAKALRGRVPLCGVCLGHQIISLAYGAETYKLKFGHRGGNHPVINVQTGLVEITSQNHSYAVKESSIKDTGLRLTHLNLLDGTVEGVSCAEDRVFSIQYHPESAPGPQDSVYLFENFISMMEDAKNA